MASRLGCGLSCTQRISVWFPLTFGQGTLFESYSVSSALGNVGNYTAWLVQTDAVDCACAVAALFRAGVSAGTRGVSPRACLAAIIGLTLLSYVFYAEFNHWFICDFCSPRYPALFVLMAAAIRYLCLKLPVEARVPVAVCACAAVIPYGIRVGTDAGIFRQADFERRYVRAAEDVAARTPQSAVVLAVQHSGSVRYYANRITLRYDWLADDHLDAALQDLIARGYHPFIVMDDWEETEFRNRFAPHSRIGRLDWPPLARVKGNPEVRIYDLGSTIK